MAGVDLVIPPTGLALRSPSEWAERVGGRDAGCIDITARQARLAVMQLELCLKTLDRHGDTARSEPRDIFGRSIRRRRIGRHAPAVAGFCRLPHAHPCHLVEIEQ